MTGVKRVDILQDPAANVPTEERAHRDEAQRLLSTRNPDFMVKHENDYGKGYTAVWFDELMAVDYKGETTSRFVGHPTFNLPETYDVYVLLLRDGILQSMRWPVSAQKRNVVSQIQEAYESWLSKRMLE